MKRSELTGKALREMGFRKADEVYGLINLDNIAEIIKTRPFQYKEGVRTYKDKEFGMCSTYLVTYRVDEIFCQVDGADGKFVKMLERDVPISKGCVYAD